MPIRRVLRPVIAGMVFVVFSVLPGFAESVQAPAAPTPKAGELRISADVPTIRVQNNSKASGSTETPAEANSGAATPVNGIGGTGGGRYTLQSNRDHIDQDAQTDIKK